MFFFWLPHESCLFWMAGVPLLLIQYFYETYCFYKCTYRYGKIPVENFWWKLDIFNLTCVLFTLWRHAGALVVRGNVFLHVLLARGRPLDAQHQLSPLGRTQGRYHRASLPLTWTSCLNQSLSWLITSGNYSFIFMTHSFVCTQTTQNLFNPPPPEGDDGLA
jgi:hypothetical protein